MTLARQLIIAIIVLFIALYAGNMAVSLVNTRTLVDEQMRIHAQDTATSVGISIAQSAQARDIASIETVFNAVSDSGFYQRIYFEDLDGIVKVDRRFSVSVEAVPRWFVQLVDLSAREGRSEVSAGWARIGNVVVVSHPGKAYAELWQVMVQQLGWFLLVTAVVCLLAYFAVKWLLRPLARVEKQADAICHQQFETQSIIPRTRELKRVVEAMNRMALKLQSIFESQLDLIHRLQTMAYRDPVTGLSNRAEFDAQLNSLASDPSGKQRAALILVSVSGLETVNALAGRQAGNRILAQLGGRIQAVLKPYSEALVGRRQGLEFAILIPGLVESEPESVARLIFEECCRQLDEQPESQPLSVHLGYAYQAEVSDSQTLLVEADTALQQCQLLSKPSVLSYGSLQEKASPDRYKTLKQWQDYIQDSINNHHFHIYKQNVYTADRELMVGSEFFVRFLQEGDEVSAGTVLPYADRLGFAERFDQHALMTIASSETTGFPGYLAINITAASVNSGAFHNWMKSFLLDNSHFANRLVLEISEHIIHGHEDAVRALQGLIAPFGAKIGVDGFGLASSSFAYLRSIPLAYVKVHRSFTSGINANPDNQFYIKSLLQIAASRDIELIVEGVETQAEFDTLTVLGIEQVQGYYLARPERVHSQ